MQVYKYILYLYHANTVLYYWLLIHSIFVFLLDFELDMFFMRLQAD